MKVIIDTNVVVSAALKDRDPEIVILFVAEQPDFQWIVSSPILEDQARLGTETTCCVRRRSMNQTLLGLGMFVLGLLVAVFNEPLARMSRAISERTGGFSLPLKWSRVINVLAGVMWLVFGLLVLFHLAPLPRLRP